MTECEVKMYLHGFEAVIPCPEPATTTVVSWCMHEHREEYGACDRHAAVAQEPQHLFCSVCFDNDPSHVCYQTVQSLTEIQESVTIDG